MNNRVPLFCLVIIFALSGLLYAAPIALSPLSVSQLEFDPVSGKDSIYIAEDGSGGTWVRGHIPTALVGMSVVLQLPTIQVNHYDLYVYQDRDLVQVQKNINPNNRKIRSRYPLYHFRVDSSHYYLHIQDQFIHIPDVEISETGHFFQQESNRLMRNSLYYGLSLMTIVFNIILYFIFHDRRFIIYSALQLSLFSIFFYQDGMLYYLFENRWDMPHFLIWNIALCATLSGLFTYYFLDLRHKVPYFRKAVPLFVGAIFGCVLLYTSTDILFFRYLSSLFFYLFPIVCVYQAAKMFREDVYARFLLLFFGLILLGGVGYTLQKYTDLPYLSFFDMNTLRLTSVIEIMGISFTLIFKVRSLREENERYREELRYHLDMLKLSNNGELTQKDNAAKLPSTPPIVSTNPQDGLIGDIAAQYQLTEREKEVLSCIWSGYSNQEIANKLCISINTTKFHVSRLYTKLDVKSRSEVRSMQEMK